MIDCKENTDAGELTGTTHKEGVLTIDFEKCSVFGIINAHSLGDNTNVILWFNIVLFCTISTSPLVVGVELHLGGEVHIEVAGKLVLSKGWLIGKVLSVLRRLFQFVFKQTSVGVQEVKNCVTNTGEREKEETLLASENGGAFEKSSFTGEGQVEFSAEQELMS